MIVINLFAGPGAGKSTTAAGLFFLMKQAGFKVELVHEYAKQMVWEERQNILTDQLYLTAKQNRCLERLRNKIDFVITDSPLLLGRIYASPDYYTAYKTLLLQLWHSYDNVNFFLKRLKPYVPLGRNQSECQAVQLDIAIELMMGDLGLKWTNIDADQKAPPMIFDVLELLGYFGVKKV